MRNILLFRRSLLLACFLFASAFCFSQVTEKWVKRQNGDANADDMANGLAVDNNGNVHVTGWSEGKGTSADYTTIKYDDDGDTKWVKRYNGPGNRDDQATAIVVDRKRNVYVTGWSTGSGTGTDYTTIKYDDDGDTKWVKRFNGPGNGSDQAIAIAVDDDGNVYVTGASTGSGSLGDITTIKYDDDGDTEWVRRYNGPGNSDDQPTAIAVDEKGNVYVTGWSTGNGTGGDYTTIKYDHDGALQWESRYNGPVNDLDRPKALAVDTSGNVYVTGFITTLVVEDEGTLTDIATIKYNASGVQQWVIIYNRKGRDIANALAVDGSGNVYITGMSGPLVEDPDNDYVTLKYNTAGVQLWEDIIDGPGSDQGGEATDLVLDAEGNVYITGGISIEQETDYATIKYTNNGILEWGANYDGPGNGHDKASAIGLDQNGNVYVTGRSRIDNFDYATIRYNAAGVQKWVKRYNSPGDVKGGADFATALAVDKDGNVHVTGGITRNNTGMDYTTYKYDKDGDREWKKTYNGSGTGPDQANAMVVDSKGNVYVTGRSDGSGTRDDYVTVKYDDDGDTKWARRYNGPGNGADQATAIAVDDDGNVYVTGMSIGSDPFFGDYATIKYDKDGNTKWVRRYNGPGNSLDQATAIGVDGEGNVYVTGQSYGSGTLSDYATIKYDANGNELWVARYNGPENSLDEANALVLDASGNIYVTGGSWGIGTFKDYTTIKYNAAGVEQWVARYDGPVNSFDNARDIALDAFGNVYVTGESADDYATVKYNTAGIQQWAARYNASSADIPNAITVDALGNVYVTGGSRPDNNQFEDYATVKYNAAGEQQWVARYNGPGNLTDVATDIAVDNNGHVYVTGHSIGSNTSSDYATIKYEQTPPIVTNPSSYLELNNLVVVYRHTNTGDIPDNYATLLNAALDETKQFYWRHSHMQLNIKWTIHVVNDNLNFVQQNNGAVFPSDIDADLRSRGFTADSYDVVMAVVNGGGALAWGANQVLGKGGYCQVPWWEEKLLFSWFMVHEFNHVIDALFASSGHPEYPHNHPGAARALGEFVPHSGTDFDLNAAIIQFWQIPNWPALRTNGNWGTIKTYTDNDLDSVPDNEPSVPLDELRFGSSTSSIDTDGDGFTDLQEAMAGIFTRTDPTITDSDGDGIPDGSDAEPIYPLNTTVPAAINLSLAQDITEWPLAGHYFFDKPDGATSSLHLAWSENNLYIGVSARTFSSQFPIELFIDANNDGLFYGNDNIKVRLIGNIITEVSLYDAAAVPAGDQQDFIISTLPVTGFSGMSKEGADGSTHQLVIPKLAQYGLNLTAGETIGIYILVEGYGTLLEPNDFLTVTLGEDANNIITRRETSAVNKEAGSTTLNARAFPNAFSSFINLQWSGSDKPVNITITDVLGRLVEKRTNVAASGAIQTGYHFRPGIYYATIVQGTEKVVLMLIKK